MITTTRTRFLRPLCFLSATIISVACTDEDNGDNGSDGDDDMPEMDADVPGPGPGPGLPDAGTPDPPDPPEPMDAAVPDSGSPDPTDAAVPMDAGDSGAVADAGFGDAGFYQPDSGAVLRPVEEAFDEGYLERLTVPDGFAVDVFATPGGHTRMLAVHGDSVYVTRPMDGDVIRLASAGADGGVPEPVTVTAGLPLIHGIVFDGNAVYLATPTELIRGEVSADGGFENLELVTDDLPDGGQHALRTLGIGPDGLLYVSVGSSCGACAETNPEHATILQFSSDLATRTVFASGLRNTIGFGWHPDTQHLWGMDNGSDWRGNDLPPEELNFIQEGNNYGWPYCFDDQVDPIIGDPPDETKEEFCERQAPPILTWQAHEAPIGLTFYDGNGFPPAYRDDAFVAMHGSWNRVPATGYSIVRIEFVDGLPQRISTFVSGFLADDGLSTFGRPAGITTHPDGSLLFSDDSNGVIYRVTRTED